MPREQVSPEYNYEHRRQDTMFSRSVLLMIAVVLAELAVGQPLTEWSTLLGGSNDERCHFVHELSDGGFLIGASKATIGTYERFLKIYELNPDGSERWSQLSGDFLHTGYYAGCATGDGGYVMVGFQADPAEDWVAHAVKVDSNGGSLWSRRYPVGYSNSMLRGVCELPGGDLLMCGVL